MTSTAYRELERRFRRYAALQDAAGFLHWDRAVVMPRGGAEARAEQLAAVEVAAHAIVTDPGTAALLAEAEPEVADDPWRAANLREMRRRQIHAGAVPPDLIEAASKARARSEMAWRDARTASDFALVAAELAELVGLTRRIAEAKAAALGVSPYEALMDEYEPGLRTAHVEALFDDLAGFLNEALPAVIERQRALPPALPLDGHYEIERQRALAVALMQRLGFDFARGRLDVSLHPFCGGGPDDVRITTRYYEHDFAQSLMGVLHETGHALYELGLPAQWRYQPVGGARGMAMHESQSLLIEMQACRSREFLAFAAPLIRKAFGRDGPAWQPDNLYRHYTAVARGLIRVDADEVTYPLHIVLRTRLERALLAGDLAVGDLPAAWNEGMAALLGLAPPDAASGCLQDIHWYDGAFGYFPTYTLGALAAAQLFAAARRDRPEIPAAIGQGDFSPLISWLRAAVHEKGSYCSTDALLVAASGAPLGTESFKAHLRSRYLEPV